MQKGYSIPTILILVLGLGMISAGFWTYSNSVNVSSSDQVRGVFSLNGEYVNPGFSVVVVSGVGTWDLVEYLCESLDECTDSAYSGKRWGTLSGGSSTGHEVVVEATKEWEDYEYIKYFVRPGWASDSVVFDVVDMGDLPESQVYTLSDGISSYNVVVSPISEVISKYSKSATFSD